MHASPANRMEADVEFGRRAVLVNDLVLAEKFYGEVLIEIMGGAISTRYMLTTEELLETQRPRPRPGRGATSDGVWFGRPPYTKVQVGRSSILLHLAPHHIQEPLPEQLRGVPRLALGATPQQMDKATEVLTRHGIPFEGPVDHAAPSPLARSLYFKDPSGNFLELCCPRGVPFADDALNSSA